MFHVEHFSNLQLPLSLPLARQRRRVLLDTLPEAALHSRRQGYARLAKLVPQLVRRGHGLLPALAAAIFEQVSLLRLPFERRRLHAQQAHLLSLAPVLAEQCAHLLEDFGVELRGRRQRVRPRDGGKIFVAQLELEGAGVQSGSRRRRPTISESRINVDSSCATSAVSSL